MRRVEEGIALRVAVPVVVIMIAIAMIVRRGMVVVVIIMVVRGVLAFGQLMPVLPLGRLVGILRGSGFGTPSAAMAPAAAGLFLRLAFDCGLGFADQRFAIGDRDPVVVGMDFAERQEAMAVSAILDETGLQRGFYAGDFGEVDVAFERRRPAISTSNSSSFFPSTTATRVSSGWVASINIVLAMREILRRAPGSAKGGGSRRLRKLGW